MDTTILKRPQKTLLEVFKNLLEGTLVQFIENNIVMFPSPIYRHWRVLDKIYRQLGNFVEDRQLEQTRFAPMDVYPEPENIFQPDILFISKECLHLIEVDDLQGATDLIIEILSPATVRYDQKVRKEVYERCGVKEYWIVDPPATKAVQGFYLNNKVFEEIERNKGVIRSRLHETEFRF